MPAATGATPGTATLHFGVTVSATPGTYTNQATAEAAGLTVVPTGDTAPITVGGGTTTTTTTTTTVPGGTTTTTAGPVATTTTAPSGATTTTIPAGGPPPVDRGPLSRTGGDAGGLLLLGALALVAGGTLILSAPGRAFRRGVRRPPW